MSQPTFACFKCLLGKSGDADPSGTGSFGRDQRREPARTRAQDEQVLAGLELRKLDRSSHAR